MSIVESRVLTAYARNLLAINESNLDELLMELQIMTQALKDNPEFTDYFFSPYLSLKERKNLLNKMLDGFSLNSNLKIILDLMIENKNLKLLPDLYNYLVKKSLVAKNLLPIEIITTYSLTKKNQKEILSLAEEILQQKLEPVFTIDQGIVGGILFLGEDFLIDLTFKKQIKILQKAFS
jgi:ATP synthase F1 delta subunit